MTRYGYHDMPENYSDVASEQVKAICAKCSRRQRIEREACRIDWEKNPTTGFVTDDMCSELDGADHTEYIQQHEW